MTVRVSYSMKVAIVALKPHLSGYLCTPPAVFLGCPSVFSLIQEKGKLTDSNSLNGVIIHLQHVKIKRTFV